MHSFSVSREVEASLDDVWSLLDRFGDTWVYHPAVSESRLVSEKPTGVGAQRECTMYDGPTIQERIINYDASLHTYEITVVEFGPMPLKQFNVTIEAERTGPKHTLITYSGFIVPKLGPIGWLMAKAMMIGQFKKMMGSLIDGIENHLQTGKIVGRNGALQP